MRDLATVFKALCDETRLSVLGLLLREDELCVCDLVEILEVTQSKASRHLRHLVNAGLLQDRREAVWVYYRIAESPGEIQAAVLSSLRELLPDQLSPKLLDSLGTWRDRKAKDGVTCKTPAARGHTRGVHR